MKSLACLTLILICALVFGAAPQTANEGPKVSSQSALAEQPATEPVKSKGPSTVLSPAGSPPCNPGNNLLNNGGFDSGDASSWTFRYRKLGVKTWKAARPSGHPEPTVIDASSPNLPQQAKDIDPYCGTHMLRINDLAGGSHSTKVTQRIKLTSVGPCSRIKVTWGAMLQDAGHPASKQPKFMIEIARKQKGALKRLKKIYEFEATASDGVAGGWEDIKKTGATTPVWYKTETFTHSIGDFEAGDEIEIRVVVRDCRPGDHGGAAFLDCAEVVDACSGDCPDPMMSPIPDLTIPNIFTPNEDGINDVWSVSNAGNACHARVDIYNRWGNKVAWSEVTKPTGPSGDTVTLWDGVKIKNKKGKRGKDVPASESPFSYVLKLDNCVDSKEYTGFFYLNRCKAETVSSDEVKGWLRGVVEVRAEAKWRQKVRANYPKKYAHWDVAADKDVVCNKSGAWWRCVANARPCGR